ncbi:HCP-like superfamily protein with MYND-type zinc finger [Rhynchospora pubera]|uniref:HCP-like superfamily protein with MYND-type zinc finger n=1 Tax=Rhynchospora pubera TaxID=906938 RepID=A0AAV8C9V8_9POAL|nr:HCP-like superfamily protein with MYND-type zinc finger [Rhynchospora pubera]
MWTRRGFCYPSVKGAPPAKRRRISPNSGSDLFETLPDDLVISILTKLSSSASSPSHLFNAFLTCKRFNNLGADPEVLANASAKSLQVRAKSWSKSAQDFLDRCTNAGNVEACYLLGMIHFYCLRNYASGADLLARAALSNHPTALYSLAVIHFNGSGRPYCHRDPSTGAALCAKSAALGNIDALREVGYCLQDGLGLPFCPSAAHRLLIKANAIELITKKKRSVPQHNYKHRKGYCCRLNMDMSSNVHQANRFMVEWWGLAGKKAENEDGLNMCSHALCGRRETRRHEFRRCAVCAVVAYCSRACQAMHWKMEHRTRCRPAQDPADVVGAGPEGA